MEGATSPSPQQQQTTTTTSSSTNIPPNNHHHPTTTIDDSSVLHPGDDDEPIHLPTPYPESYTIRQHVQFTKRKFDISTLPADLRRVYHELVTKHNEEYALTFVFIVRTGVELHRAWHLTLLTSKILQRVKKKFKIRCTWNLGVLKLIFRVDDGAFELHRKVPYDYDSEFQDLYMRLAMALTEGHITIHEALIYQMETKLGEHTAPSGLLLRNPPGRLVLYPLEAATCAVIFFDGDWSDAGVAAICGFAAGVLEWALGAMSDFFGSAEVKILVDVLAGGVTGIIGGLFYRYMDGHQFCLSSIFLGTLYWFFYGTAFVIGILEIIAGELETGVTRFIAVSVKTFVLCLSSALGLMLVIDTNIWEEWTLAYGYCNKINLNDQWWRIPLYLLCSVSALGQYRFPIADYWRGLIVQLVGYEIQYQVKRYLEPTNQIDFLDTAAANVSGAMGAVVIASIIRYLVDELGQVYTSRLLKSDPPDSILANFLYKINVCYIKTINICYLGRKTELKQLQLETSLKKREEEVMDPNHPRTEIILTDEEEKALMEAIVEAQGLNLWALLMPAVYQLVPGSMIAKMWYNVIFPPPLTETEQTNPSDGFVFIDQHVSLQDNEVFYGLWVVSLSLAMGLVLGNTIVSLFSLGLSLIRCLVKPRRDETVSEKDARRSRQRFQQQGVIYEVRDEDDPDGGGGGGRTDKKTDEPLEQYTERTTTRNEKRKVPPVVTPTQETTIANSTTYAATGSVPEMAKDTDEEEKVEIFSSAGGGGGDNGDKV